MNHRDGAAMNGFVDLHGASITGVINTFDRVILKGHLNGFFPDGAFGRYLSRRGILLKDAGRFFEAETQRIRDHVVSLAAAAGRPVEYLTGSSTHRSGTSKEARARAIAERDGVTERLVCVLSVVEPCRSFTLARRRPGRLRARRADPEPAQHEGGQAPAAQAAEEAGAGATRHGDRQAGFLRRGEEGDHAGGRASPAQGAQQPGRELPPADPTTRT